MIEVRGLRAEDHAAWLPLWQGYQRFYKVDIPAEVGETAWRRMLDEVEPMWGALALADGQALGLAHYVRHRTTWAVGDYCYLNDLYVDEGARGRGVGRALIAHVGEEARRLGCSRVYWLTHETNAEARRLYDGVAERSGFIEYGRGLDP
ncbi:GNAT family N-acetyltransferase [Ancylobacter mangrovi]|uniref:GNAT family N-acetyltransferase n=1 Tax=Ancylobacter mangrovi TaxID=2972472 RepID=UPI002162745C|nr:GNAT family N-acetyltransferase [Ancylobacter mangrovi]MCS0503105.1 GNAT family N-acetyltransferase [Ancylobacter mangrovi]